jgi:hypothetical protein
MSRGKSRANCLFLLCKLAVFTAGKLFSLTIRFTAAATFGGYIYYFSIIKDKFVNEIIIAAVIEPCFQFLAAFLTFYFVHIYL